MSRIKLFYTGPELAEALGVTRARVWQLTRDGLIPAQRGPGGHGGIYIYSAVTYERLRREGLPRRS